MAKDNDKSTGGVTDLARKIFLTGVGAVFLTEETIRKSLTELKLPTDAVSNLVETFKKQKDDVLELVAAELRNFLAKINIHEEIQKALRGTKVHLNAEITFDKKGEANQSKVTIKQS